MTYYYGDTGYVFVQKAFGMEPKTGSPIPHNVK